MSTVEQIETRLLEARARLDRATTAKVGLDSTADRVTPGRLADGTYDSAMLSGIRSKPNPRADERRFNTYSKQADAQRVLDDLRNGVRVLEKQLARAIAERDRVRFTGADLAGATMVRDRNGWHKVVKVNAKSVSVETGYSWTDRIPVEDILQRHPDSDS